MCVWRRGAWLGLHFTESVCDCALCVRLYESVLCENGCPYVCLCVCACDARVFECVCMCMSKCVSGVFEHVSAFF